MRTGTALAVIFLTASLTATSGQSLSAQDTSKENYLAALSQIFGNQPDYSADIDIVVASPMKMRIARRDGRVRLEWLNPRNTSSGRSRVGRYYRTVVINQPDQASVAIDPQQQVYCTLPNEFRPPGPDMLEALKEMMKGKEEFKVRLKNVGTQTVDRHETVKMEMTLKGEHPSQREQGGLFFYFAKDLKNLVMKIEVTELYEDAPTPKGKGWSYTLSNVSLAVPDELFQIPAGYKIVDFKSFMATFKQNTSK